MKHLSCKGSLLSKRFKGDLNHSLSALKEIYETNQKDEQMIEGNGRTESIQTQSLNEEPLSPYMKAKRELARPKKPLSAYIYFS